MHELHPIPGCRIDQVVLTDPMTVEIAAHRQRTSPACSQPSTSPHGGYSRRPADLPSVGRQVRLVLWVRRFLCRNAGCGRRTVAEPLPGLIAPHARRTRRLAAAQSRVAVAASGEAGARLLGQIGMPTSPDTLLRLVRRLPLPVLASPRALGVDDWAICKERTYGSILVDLERRRVVDLLPDRSAGRLADWLRRRRGIRILTRDWSTEYARGMTVGALQAQQVADRWHLLQNVGQMAERWLAARPWQAPTAASRRCGDDNASTARWGLPAEPGRDRRRC